MLFLAILNASLVASLALYEAEKAVQKTTEKELQGLRIAIQMSLQSYLGTIKEDLIINSKAPSTFLAFESFNQAWQALEGINKTQYLQDKYITDNSNEAGKSIYLMPLKMAPCTARNMQSFTHFFARFSNDTNIMIYF